MCIDAIAFIFTSLGIWLALKLTNPKVETVVIEKEVHIHSNERLFEGSFTGFEREKPCDLLNC
jgi:hypothetical protein